MIDYIEIEGYKSIRKQKIELESINILINHFSPDDIITVDQKDGASEFSRLESEKLDHWLNDYSLGELWQQSIIVNGQPQQAD